MAKLAENHTANQIAKMYHVTPAAVRQRLAGMGLEAKRERVSLRSFIPWVVPVRFADAYENKMLHAYWRGLGVGAPLRDVELEAKQRAEGLSLEETKRLTILRDLRGQLALFIKNMDKLEAVVDFDPLTGFILRRREAWDRHYTRWPRGVPDNRDAALDAANNPDQE